MNDKTLTPGAQPPAPSKASVPSAINGSAGISKLTDAHYVAMVNAKHALVVINGKLSVMWLEKSEGGVPVLSPINEVKNYWKKGQRGKVNAIDVWIRSNQRREYDRMVFRPGCTDTGKDYNLWRGWGVTPDPHGDCSLFLNHLQYVVCSGDDDLFDYVEQWLANAVQTPEDKPGTALNLRGKQGTGKGAFVRGIAPIFGVHLLRLQGSEQLYGRFNDMLAGKQIIFIDEAWLGNKAANEKVKSYITENTITIERKFVSAFEIDNYARFIFATNRDHAAPAEMDDRRFVPLNVSDAHVGDQRYWNRLEAECAAGGPAALLHHLQNVPLTRNLRLTPKTGALAEQKLLSLDDVGRFTRELLMQPSHRIEAHDNPSERPRLKWGEITTPLMLHRFYLDWCQRNRVSYPKSLDALGTAMRKFTTLVRREARKDEREQLGLDDRTHVYVLPTLTDGREQFAKALGQSVPWPDDKPLDPVPSLLRGTPVGIDALTAPPPLASTDKP